MGAPEDALERLCDDCWKRPNPETLVYSCPLLIAYRQVSIPALEMPRLVCLTAREDCFGECLTKPDYIEGRKGQAKPKADLKSIPNPQQHARTVPKGLDPPTAGGTSTGLGRTLPPGTGSQCPHRRRLRAIRGTSDQPRSGEAIGSIALGRKALTSCLP